MYENGFEGVMEKPVALAVRFSDILPPEQRQYTLFLYFIDGYDQERTFEFINGQETVRELVKTNVDIIDFEKSLISSWEVKPSDSKGFIKLVQFMQYLDELVYQDDNSKVYDDGFSIVEYLNSQTEISTLSDREREYYENAIALSMQDSKMIDINRLEEGEDIN